MRDLISDIFFVPFGGEPGGYLDLLGLKPGASAAEAAQAELAYVHGLSNEIKVAGRTLREKLKAGEITKEELEEAQEELQQNKTDKQATLNELQTKFESELAEARRLARQGKTVKTESWFQLVRSDWEDEEAFWQFLTATRPLSESRPAPVIDPPTFTDVLGLEPGTSRAKSNKAEAACTKELKRRNKAHVKSLEKRANSGEITPEECEREIGYIREAEARWLAELSSLRSNWEASPTAAPDPADGTAKLSEKPTGANKHSGPLSRLAQFVRRRTQDRFRIADVFWSHVPHTNREFWLERLDCWLADIAGNRVEFSHEAEAAVLGEKDRYPFLARPTRHRIEKLEEGEMEFATGPNRNRESIDRSKLKSLKDMLGDESGDLPDLVKRLLADETDNSNP